MVNNFEDLTGGGATLKPLSGRANMIWTISNFCDSRISENSIFTNDRGMEMRKRFLHFAAIAAVVMCAFTGVVFLSDCRAEENTVEVTLRTTMGDIVLELNKEKAPKTVANFLQYLDEGFYDGTIFHRVVKDFVIQGGGFDKNLNQKPTRPPIVNEAGNGLSNVAYTIAMARTNDPNSATSQFYINLRDNSASLDQNLPLNPGYAVFGRVVGGKDVVDAISKVNTVSVGYHEHVPAKSIIIGDGGSSGGSDSTCFLSTLLR
jgi:cyclophilin family peptidyl-prolyl cis-trans isomerase